MQELAGKDALSARIFSLYLYVYKVVLGAMPFFRAGRRLAFESESSEDIPFLSTMGKIDQDASDISDHHQAIALKAFPEAVVTESSLFARAGNHTFETDSLESFYKPIDSYEGIHRFDPSFEWEAKEEKRLVRKVCLFRSTQSRYRFTLLIYL